MESEVDGEERVIATAEQIVMRLGTTHGMTQDMLNILSTFDHRFSNITDRLEAHLEDRLLSAQQVLLRWDAPNSAASSRHQQGGANQEMIWDGPADEGRAYLGAVDEIHNLMNAFHVTDGDKPNDTLERAQSVHSVAMGRLSQEFRHALLNHKEPLQPHRFSVPPKRVSFSFASLTDDREHGPDDEEEIEKGGEDYSGVVASDSDSFSNDGRLHLITDLKEIAKRLVAGNREQECYQIYSSARRTILDENLITLGVEKLSIEEIQKIVWDQLEDKIKKWVRAIKVAVRVLFAREKDMCNQIFEDMDSSAKEFVFSETCRAPMMRLLSFSEAVALSRRSPEKLFRILDMYETLSDMMLDINDIFCEEESIREEASGILVKLGEAARSTFKEFANAIQRETSRKPIPGGAIHPVTRYVMNYIKFLFDYTDTLKLLFVCKKEQTSSPSRKSLSAEPGGDNKGLTGGLGFLEDCQYNEDPAAMNLSPLVQQLFLILEFLKCNLDGKSKLYKDSALTYLFLMNNVRYIVQKVRGSELITHLGDDWVRKHSGQVRQYATNYQRATWNKVLSCLKDEGIQFTGTYSGSASKGALKERFKRFNTSFEEVYKTQTNWTVPDPQLREELRISITEKLLPAYRSFVGRFGIYLEGERHVERYLKYTPEELENYLLDLFEGLPGPMSSQRTKSLP
ncbi:hypothetical protein SUGI_0331340 [Cryptomeria japonica]|uniref:exocyst complex component EXO70B1 n=1 Tax=Cryptomeria japonica TaxID=3369 RepID=UPI002408BE58|nr:exocyst complex component EXO70B1 [Cryptomeria japonica]GLJ18604.1 hypothetical protein SUGI_0331340 [Cryptomeria japonica]